MNVGVSLHVEGTSDVEMRENIEGVLHVIRTRKANGSLFERLIVGKLEDDGILEAKYYPPTFFILSEQTIGDRRTDSRESRSNQPFSFRFKGRPKALSHEQAGHLISVKASVKSWHNGYGGYLERPRIVSVGEYVECPHHDDPYRGQISGSSRIYCDSWLKELTPTMVNGIHEESNK